MKYYTGIGSRQTPADVLTLMTRTAEFLRQDGWTLRSGHATGADWAFEQGAQRDSIIYLPWPEFGQKPYGDDPGRPVLGTRICDEKLWRINYDYLVSLGIRSKSLFRTSHTNLHGRNVAQVLGLDAKVPSKFVLCWCPEVNGKPQGGTATAVLLAQHHGIPVFNLWRPEDRAKIESKIRPDSCSDCGAEVVGHHACQGTPE